MLGAKSGWNRHCGYGDRAKLDDQWTEKLTDTKYHADLIVFFNKIITEY